MQLLERCDFMCGENQPMIMYVRVCLYRSMLAGWCVFFALLVKDKKDWSEQIFSHKSSYTQCVCTLSVYAVFVAPLEQKSDK